MLFRKILYFLYLSPIIIVILSLIVIGILYFQFKKQAPSLEMLEMIKTKEPKNVIETLPLELQNRIKQEQQKIRSIRGIIEKIQGRTLTVKASSEGVVDKVFQVDVLPKAKVNQTKIDSKTSIPKISEFSFEKIKNGDEIIAWSEDDLREKDGFETEYLEVMIK